jgi:hypothetical protein
LCLSGLGGAAHPDELRERLDARQIADYQAFENIEGFGAPHLEKLIGILCREIVNRSFNAPQIMATEEEFMPHAQPVEIEPQTEEQLHAKIQAIKRATRGTRSQN